MKDFVLLPDREVEDFLWELSTYGISQWLRVDRWTRQMNHGWYGGWDHAFEAAWTAAFADDPTTGWWLRRGEPQGETACRAAISIAVEGGAGDLAAVVAGAAACALVVRESLTSEHFDALLAPFASIVVPARISECRILRLPRWDSDRGDISATAASGRSY